MADAELRTSVAHEILREALDLWLKEGEDIGQHRELVDMPNGDVAIALDIGPARPPFGQLYSHYIPIGAVEEMLKACEREFNNFSIVERDESGAVIRMVRLEDVEGKPGEREGPIKAMARVGVFSLLTNLPTKMRETLQENFEDSIAIVGAMLANNATGYYGGTEVAAGSHIRTLANDSAKRRENHLRYYLEQLEYVQAFIDSGGRPVKVNTEAVFASIKKLGKQASQKTVANTLGVNARTIRNWQERAGFKDWAEVAAAFAASEKDRK